MTGALVVLAVEAVVAALVIDRRTDLTAFYVLSGLAIACLLLSLVVAHFARRVASDHAGGRSAEARRDRWRERSRARRAATVQAVLVIVGAGLVAISPFATRTRSAGTVLRVETVGADGKKRLSGEVLVPPSTSSGTSQGWVLFPFDASAGAKGGGVVVVPKKEPSKHGSGGGNGWVVMPFGVGGFLNASAFVSGTIEVSLQGKGELKIEVGKRGERGKTGPRGFKGDNGAKGPKGAKGAKGAKGDKGDKGNPGATVTVYVSTVES